MKRSVYVYGRNQARALISVPLFGGRLPSVVEWRDVVYYWDEQRGGYLTSDVHKVSQDEVRVEFGWSVDEEGKSASQVQTEKSSSDLEQAERLIRRDGARSRWLSPANMRALVLELDRLRAENSRLPRKIG